MRLALLRIGAARSGVDDIANLRELQIDCEFVGLAAGGESNPAAALLQFPKQLSHAWEGANARQIFFPIVFALDIRDFGGARAQAGRKDLGQQVRRIHTGIALQLRQRHLKAIARENFPPALQGLRNAVDQAAFDVKENDVGRGRWRFRHLLRQT